MPTNTTLTQKQHFYREMVLGTLIYAVVLGFFNDYTNILYTDSYSVTFLVAIVMQMLTYGTLLLKKKVGSWFKAKPGAAATIGSFIAMWFVLFMSKFVFLVVLDFVFSDAVAISGFIGLMIVIITMTIVKVLIDFGFKKLA